MTFTAATTTATPTCEECDSDLQRSGAGHYWACRYCGSVLPVTA
jgi:ribosomal protein L37AE/L43A